MQFAHINYQGVRTLADVDIDNIRLLINNGVDINRQDLRGNTALHYAAEYNNDTATKVLLRYGANADVRNMQDQLPQDLCEGFSRMQRYDVETLLRIARGEMVETKPALLDFCHSRHLLEVFRERGHNLLKTLKPKLLAHQKSKMQHFVLCCSRYNTPKKILQGVVPDTSVAHKERGLVVLHPDFVYFLTHFIYGASRYSPTIKDGRAYISADDLLSQSLVTSAIAPEMLCHDELDLSKPTFGEMTHNSPK